MKGDAGMATDIKIRKWLEHAVQCGIQTTTWRTPEHMGEISDQHDPHVASVCQLKDKVTRPKSIGTRTSRVQEDRDRNWINNVRGKKGGNSTSECGFLSTS